MRILKTGLAALALAATLAVSSCNGTNAVGGPSTDISAVEARVTKLMAEPAKGKATAAADIAGFRDALPKEISLTWANLSFDAATATTVLTDVKLTPASAPQVGLSIAELRLTDFDAAFAKARITGQRLTETAPLATRIDAKGVKLFGMAAFINQMSAAMTMNMENAFPHGDEIVPAPATPGAVPPPQAVPAAAPAFGALDYSFDRIVLDNVALRPYDATPGPAGASSDVMPPEMLQLAAVERGFNIDTYAATGGKLNAAMTEDGVTVKFQASVPTMGGAGMRGFDFDTAYMRNFSMMIDAGGGAAGGPQSFQLDWGLFSLQNMKLDKLYGYLMKGVVPPRTETDLTSFGVWHSEKESWKLDGKEIYGVGESTIDARGFHWLIPSHITATGKNITLDLGAIAKYASQFATEMSGTIDGPQSPITGAGPEMDPAKVVALLEKYGLSKPVMNYNAGWDWNPASGDSKLNLAWGADKFMSFNAVYEGGFPSFKAVSDVVPDNAAQTNPEAVMNVFNSQSTLKLVNVDINDDGGLDKAFGITSELSGMSAGGASTADSATAMRTMAASFLKLMGSQAAQQMPAIPALVNPIADFITSGGKLHMEMKPGKPLPLASLAAMQGGDPSAMIATLGLKAEHSGGKK